MALRPASRDTWPVAIGLVVAGLLHACFGAYGWYNRYEFRKTLPPGVVVVIKSDLKNPAPSLIPTP